MENGPNFCGLLTVSHLYRNGLKYDNGKSENNQQSYKYKKRFGPNFASAYDEVVSREKRYSLETPSISSNVSVSSMVDSFNHL